MVDFSVADGVIAGATLLGPIFAVEAQKHLDRLRGADERRRAIFKTLMATRAALLATAHVEALNAVPVEFHGRGRALKRINDAWKEYLDHLSMKPPADAVWLSKRNDLFYNLLSAMSDYLGYSFTRSQLQQDVYAPIAHANVEGEQAAIRQGLTAILTGKAALPMSVVSFPGAAESEPPAPALESSDVAPLAN